MPTPEQIALVQELLPSVAVTDYGWTENVISDLMRNMNFGPTEAVRYFWLQRVNETSEYLDVNGKPLTQIRDHARTMLAYWDNVLKTRGTEAIGPGVKQPIQFHEIERPTRQRRRRYR